MEHSLVRSSTVLSGRLLGLRFEIQALRVKFRGISVRFRGLSESR